MSSQVGSPPFHLPTPEEVLDQMERILESRTFSHSASLKTFLRYVTEKTVEGSIDQIKETVLGVEVFGRREDFDGRTDNVVRVQAHRLRDRLRKYYSVDGVSDEIIIDIPKGHYVPQFVRRGSSGNSDYAATAQDSHPRPRAGAASQAKPRSLPKARLTAAGMLLFMMGGATAYLFQAALHWITAEPRFFGEATLQREDFLPLWAPFCSDGTPTIVAFSNPVFLRTQTEDLLRYTGPRSGPTDTPVTVDPSLRLHVRNLAFLDRAGPLEFEDGFTGWGEVNAVHALTRAFDVMQTPLRVKRSRLLVLDDMTHHHIVFLGSPWGNEILGLLSSEVNFVFHEGIIINRQPISGEPRQFAQEHDPVSGAITADYSLIAFLPGNSEGKMLSILAGISTVGTFGAAQFVATPADIQGLVRRLGDKEGHLPQYFEAVLQHEVIKDEISRTTFVAWRPFRQRGPATQ